jgi:hypothetical protein
VHKKDYASEKEAKKRNTTEGIWLLMAFIAVFIVIIIRFAIGSGSGEGLLSLMPSGNDAYAVAKIYIRPSLRAPDVKFADDSFQFAKGADSVYVIKSYFEAIFPGGEKVKTNFRISLKYTGGTISNERNWLLISLDEH